MGQEEEREGMAAAAHPRLDGEQPEEPEMTEGCVLLKQTNQLVVGHSSVILQILRCRCRGS